MTTRFRPTLYRDCHLGHAWCAWMNWQLAYRTGGEFLLLADDTMYRIEACNTSGAFPIDVMADRAAEDLEWLGMKADRVLFPERDHRHLHAEAAQKLGLREPKILGTLPIRMNCAAGLSNPWPNDLGPGGEGWIGPYERTLYDPWFFMTTAVDDHEYGVQAFWRGIDLIGTAALQHHFCERLGYVPPLMNFVPNLKRQQAWTKESKTCLETITIRELREFGYEGEAVMATIRECVRRSREQGLEAVIIPVGVLELDEIVTLAHRNRGPEWRAAGKGSEGEPWQKAAQTGARELLRRGVR